MILHFILSVQIINVVSQSTTVNTTINVNTTTTYVANFNTTTTNVTNFNTTTANTTPIPTTTVSTSLHTTTAFDKVTLKCKILKNYTFQLPATCIPCEKCFKDKDEGFVGDLADLMKCRETFGEYPIDQLKEEPLLITFKVNELLRRLSKENKGKTCSKYFDFEKTFLLTFGHKFRFSDQNLPDYTNLKFKNRRWERTNDTIEIPYGNIVKGEYTYVFTMYKNFTDKKLPIAKQRLKKIWSEHHPIINGEYLDPRSEEGLYVNNKLEFNSVIMSLHLTPSRSPPLPGENKISFTKLDRSMVNPICVYWQPLKPTIPGELPTTGYWSNYGIRVHKVNISMTVCMASQMGLFAVVAEKYIPPAEEPVDPLDVLVVILTIISCAVNIVFILSFFMLKCVKNPYSRIYLSIALSCLLSQLLFLGGLSNRDTWYGCTQIGTWIQFFHLAIISWIMIESVHQLSRIRYFFNEKTNIDIFYLVLGWGFPLAVLIALQGFPYEKFEKPSYCWIYVNGYDLWFFAGPIAVMLFITIVIRIIMFTEIKKAPEKKGNDINYTRAYNSIIASAALIPTFLAIWGFGTLAMKSTSAIKGVAMIALPLLNLAMGVEIFYYYFYRNDEIRDALHRELKIREKQKLGTYHYLRGLNMKVAYRAQSRQDVNDEVDEEADETSNDGSQIALHKKTKESRTMENNEEQSTTM